MFEEIRDQLSLLASFHWPTANGEITAIDIERFGRDRERIRLSVAYEFWVNDDGPYTGESFWEPMFSLNSTDAIKTARHKLHLKQPIQVRYRPGDPSVNTARKELRELLR